MAREHGTVRARELAELSIPRTYLQRLTASGQLVKLARGLYAIPDGEISEDHTLAVVAGQAPEVVFCLLTALRFHGLTTQNPSDVWIAIARGAWKPVCRSCRLRVVRLSNLSFETAVEEHRIEGTTVRVFSPAKTVADCFKFRSQVGLDVAIEALKDAWNQRKATMDEIVRCAKACRVDNVMRPYLEAIVS